MSWRWSRDYRSSLHVRKMSLVETIVTYVKEMESLIFRECTEMSKVAYDLLTTEDSAEWACNECITEKDVPMIKMVQS